MKTQMSLSRGRIAFLSFAAAMAGMISESVIDNVDGGFIGMGLFICYGTGEFISGYLGDKIKPIFVLTRHWFLCKIKVCICAAYVFAAL